MTNEYYPCVEGEEYAPNADGYHSDEFSFCQDLKCGCHEDPGEIANTAQYVEDGEMTTSEADQYYRGLTI